jgi:regulator of RNase E activity RraA
VCPGDLVLGDDDGVVVVPREVVDEVLALAERKHAAEEVRIRETKEGKLFLPEIDATLKSKGVDQCPSDR